MIRLALCDDEEDQRSALMELLDAYATARPQVRLCPFVFSSGQELLLSEHPADFDLYLLDVIMPELSGIEVGARLRERGSRGEIVYLTFSSEYAVASYETRAFYYLLKPVEPDHLYSVLDQAIAEIKRQKSDCILVKTRDCIRRIPFDAILWAELNNRTVLYHLLDEEEVSSVTVRRPFQEEIQPLLACPRFVLCGVSFVVNLQYVNAAEKNFLRLDSGIRLSIPRGAAVRIRQQWMDYWLNR
ncbi:MAG: response regulator transcription factor [Lachnospiraceae bacterium]|nr:response regulator transcription factor [Lachnospiraceae bacterium]